MAQRSLSLVQLGDEPGEEVETRVGRLTTVVRDLPKTFAQKESRADFLLLKACCRGTAGANEAATLLDVCVISIFSSARFLIGACFRGSFKLPVLCSRALSPHAAALSHLQGGS